MNDLKQQYSLSQLQIFRFQSETGEELASRRHHMPMVIQDTNSKAET